MDLRRIHYLRHGTEEPSENVWLSYQAISKITRLNVATLFYALKRYKARGNKFVNGRQFNFQKAWTRQTILKGAIKDFLLSHKVLTMWVNLSLDQRCKELEHMGVCVKRDALSKFYRKNKTSYVVVKYQYQQAAKQPPSVI